MYKSIFHIQNLRKAAMAEKSLERYQAQEIRIDRIGTTTVNMAQRQAD